MRKKTNLEEALIERGWKLSSKSYKGRQSERTGAYVYSKTIPLDGDTPRWLEPIIGKVLLNSKRDKIVDKEISIYVVGEFNKKDPESLGEAMQKIENEIASITVPEVIINKAE